MGNKLKSTYSRIQPKLPGFVDNTIKSISGSLIHPRLGMKAVPKKVGDIEISPFKFDCQGALCISADFEMSWAWMYDEPEYQLKGKDDRKYFSSILNALDKYDIPITWATVGHLFLESCTRSKKDGKPHPDMPRPKNHYTNIYWSWSKGDWYQHDPCTDIHTNPDWYGKDLIEKIMASGVDHEIGTHTFSHIDFSEENCDKNLAEKELKKCIDVMADFKIAPRSIVFPGGFEGNFEILAPLGIISYRSMGLVELSYPNKTDHELWEIPQSIFLFSHENENYLAKTERYIKKGIANNMVCHLGFHPSDVNETNLERTFIPILDFVSRKRDDGSLWIATMKEIASYCEARENVLLKSELKNNIMKINIDHTMDFDRFDLTELTFKVKLPSGRSIKALEFQGKNQEIGSKESFVREKENILVITAPNNCQQIKIKFS